MAHLNQIPRDTLSVAPAVFSAMSPRVMQTVEPLAQGRFKIQLTASTELHDKLRMAQALLRHQVPDGNLSAVLERALDALLAERMKKKFAVSPANTARATKSSLTAPPTPKRTEHPESGASSVESPEAASTTMAPKDGSQKKKASRHIPNEVRREVFGRDGLQCSFVDAEGNRCPERGGLQFHHADVPFGKGGEHTAANVRLYCHAHNQHAAELDYGRDVIEAHRQRKRAQEPQQRVPQQQIYVFRNSLGSLTSEQSVAQPSPAKTKRKGGVGSPRATPSSLQHHRGS
jgi:hypothetical protein